MHIDEATPQVVRVTVTYEGEVLQEHAHVRDRGQFSGGQLVTIVLVVPLQVNNLP